MQLEGCQYLEAMLQGEAEIQTSEECMCEATKLHAYRQPVY